MDEPAVPERPERADGPAGARTEHDQARYQGGDTGDRRNDDRSEYPPRRPERRDAPAQRPSRDRGERYGDDRGRGRAPGGQRGDDRGARPRTGAGGRTAAATGAPTAVRVPEPALTDDITAAELDAEVRRDLRGLQRDTAESVARHLVAAGRLVDEDPELALAHARFARTRASRIAMVREAAGIAAYHAGEWAEALGELRAARRMGGGPGHLAVMADIERALGRPERALELSRGPDVRSLDRAEGIELAIVAAGARRDLGEIDAAVVSLQIPELDPARRDPWSARLFYAYADNLLAAGREADALQWFVHAADADDAGETDADRRIAQLTGEPLPDDDIAFGPEEEDPETGTDAIGDRPGAAVGDRREEDDADETDPAALDSAGLPSDPGAEEAGADDAGSGRAAQSDPAEGMVAAHDAGSIDAGSVETGTVDAGTVDAGTVDAGTVDAGTVDAGTVETDAVDADTVVTDAVADASDSNFDDIDVIDFDADVSDADVSDAADSDRSELGEDESREDRALDAPGLSSDTSASDGSDSEEGGSGADEDVTADVTPEVPAVVAGAGDTDAPDPGGEDDRGPGRAGADVARAEAPADADGPDAPTGTGAPGAEPGERDR